MTDQALIAHLLGAHKRIASITASKHTNALEAINEAKQIAEAAIAAAEAREGGDTNMIKKVQEACAEICIQEACGGSNFNSAARYMAERIRNADLSHLLAKGDV